MAFLNSLNISGSALTAQRLRLDIISQNIANADTTRTENGGPYRRKSVILEAREPRFSDLLNGSYTGEGVRIRQISEDESPFKSVYDPTHADADENGYVLIPNVDMVREMIDMISANRSYQANITALNSTKLLASKALEIGK